MHSRLTALNNELGILSEFITSRGLPDCAEATDLEVAEVGPDGKTHLLTPAAADAWRRLKAAALSDGISLFVVSAFRSIDRQAEIVRRKLASGAAIQEILSVCAPPGFSEHHTGRAVDLSAPDSPLLEVQFDQTPTFAWLMKNASMFGYHLSYPIGNQWGYQYEPWHWCFHPVAQQSTPPAPASLR